jgi:YidC/Oxa1 family membrane protein insertase
MEINKRTILWIVFAVSLVVLWNDWMVSNGKQSMFSARRRPRSRRSAARMPKGTTAVPPRASRAVPGAAACRPPPRARVQTEDRHHHHRRLSRPTSTPPAA